MSEISYNYLCASAMLVIAIIAGFIFVQIVISMHNAMKKEDMSKEELINTIAWMVLHENDD